MPAFTPQEMDHRRLMEAARLMRSVPTGGVSDPQRVGVPDPSTEIPVPETPEEQQSLLSQIGGSALSAFGAVGNLLDLPGSMLRDVIAIKNPLDQLLSPFSHENRVTGRDLLTQYGITEANKETGMSGWIDDPMEGVRDVGGFLAEVALDPLNMFFAPVKAASTAAKAGTKAGAKVATEAGEAAAKAAAPAGRGLFQNIVDPFRFSEMGQKLGGKFLDESAEGIAKATDEGVSLMARATGRGISKAAQKTGRLVERTGEAIAKSEREGLKRLGGFIKGMPAATKFAAVRTGMKAREFWNQAFNFAAKGAKFSETQKQFIDASLKAIEMDAADLDVLHKYLQTSARKRKDEILAEGGTFSRENEIEFFTAQNGLLSDAIEGKPGALELFDPEVQEVIAGIKGRQAQKRELLEQLGVRLRDFEDPVVDFMYRYLTEFQKDARIRETLGSRSKKGTGQLFSPFFREEVFRGAFSEDLKRVTSDDYIRQLIYGIQDGDHAADVIRKVHEGKLDDSSLKPALNVETFKLENGAESLVDSLRADELIGSGEYGARKQALLSDINKDLGELRDAAGGEIRTVAGLTPYGLRLELIADRMRQLGGASAGNISQHFRKITDDGKYFLHRNPEVEKTLSEIEAMGDWQYVTGGDDILFQSGDLVRYIPNTGAAPRFGVYTVENGVGKFREGVTRFSDKSKIDVSINELELLTPKRALVENGKVVDTFVYEDRFDRLADYLIDHPESFEGGRGVFGNDPLADLEKGFQNSNWIVANFGVLKDMFVKGGKTILEPGDVFGQADLVDEVGRVLLAPKSLVPEGGSTTGIRLKDALFELFGYSVDVDDLLKEIAEANPQLLNKGRGSQGLLASVKQAEQNYTSLVEEMGALSPVPDSPWQSLLEGKFSREGLSEGASVLGDVALEKMSLAKLKEMAKKLGIQGASKTTAAGKADLIKSIQEVPDQLLKSIAGQEGELTLKNLKAAVQDVVGAESTANQVQAYRAIESLMGVKTPGRNLAERGENILESLRDPKDVVTELGGRVAEAERLYKNADKKLMDDVGNWQVNPELFNDITDVLSGAKASSDDFFPGGSQGAIANAFRSFTAMFKAGVLTWPARYTRDVAGGQINNMLNGMYSYRSSKNAWGVMHNKPLENLFDNPNEYASLRKYLQDQGIDPMRATGQQVTEAIQRLYAATKGHSSTVMRDIDFVGQEVVMDRVLSELLDRGPGIGGEGLMDDLAIMGRAIKSGSWNPLDIAGVYSRAAKGPRATTEFGLAKSADLVGKMTDDFNRMSGFMELLRKGEDPLEAMKKVNRVQVDYNPSTFTPTEQALKRIFPFYSFMSRQGAYVTNELLTNPTGRLGNFIRAVRLGEGEDSRTLPEHVKATFALDVTGMPLVGGAEPGSSQYMTGFGLMFEDTINMLPTGGASDFFRDIVGRTNPLLKGPLEWAFGRSSFQGGPMGGRDLASMDPSLGRIFTQLGIQDPLPNEQAAPAFGSRGLEFALANSPVSRLLSTTKGLLDYDRKSLTQRASNALLGMKLTTVNQQQRRRGVRELMNARMKEAGVRPFETYQPSQEYIKGLPEGEERKALEIITALTKSFERERKAKKKAKQDGR